MRGGSTGGIATRATECRPQPDTLTGFAAAVSGYLIGALVPLGIAVGAAAWWSSANPSPSDENCWHDWTSHCQWGWAFMAIIVLTYIWAMVGLGPLGSAAAIRISGQPGGAETAMWGVALSPLHLIDTQAVGEGVVPFSITVAIVSSAVGFLARMIWSAREKARERKHAARPA